MRVISNKALVDFSVKHSDAGIPLQIWRKTVEAVFFTNFAGLKRAFNSVDKVRGLYVFNVGGNKFRLVAAVHFDVQKLYVRHIFTHKEYDEWTR